MKTIFHKFLLLIVTIILFTQCKNPVYVQGIKEYNSELPGQSAPNDMVFIQGDENMPSYYIGVSEEPNINYVIYLRWLSKVYQDYPQVFYDALPKASMDTSTTHINEPLIKGYLTNPAYAYYPIVNLTWQQIQNYLHWKTDRLNEAILLKKNVLLNNFNIQLHEYNFVTEAYINQQYDGIINKKKYVKILPNDGVLFSGFRLPTEAEWEYANKKYSIENQFIKQPTNRKLEHPFGKSYFSLFWAWNDNDKIPNNSLKTVDKTLLNNYNIDYTAYEKENYLSVHKDTVNQRVFRMILDYPKNSYGVINMHSGVKEWLLDAYQDSIVYSNWLSVMKSGGFNVSNPIHYDEYGLLEEKDSLGQMVSFRYIGFEPNGNFKAISRFTDGMVRKRVVKGGTWKEPGNFRYGLNETSYGNNIGFRCVLPYSGAPVKKGYKVNWDNKIPDIYK